MPFLFPPQVADVFLVACENAWSPPRQLCFPSLADCPPRQLCLPSAANVVGCDDAWSPPSRLCIACRPSSLA